MKCRTLRSLGQRLGLTKALLIVYTHISLHIKAGASESGDIGVDPLVPVRGGEGGVRGGGRQHHQEVGPLCAGLLVYEA